MPFFSLSEGSLRFPNRLLIFFVRFLTVPLVFWCFSCGSPMNSHGLLKVPASFPKVSQFSIGFPLVFLWLSWDPPIVYCWLFYDVALVSDGFPLISYWFLTVSLLFSYRLPVGSYVFRVFSDSGILGPNSPTPTRTKTKTTKSTLGKIHKFLDLQYLRLRQQPAIALGDLQRDWFIH